jgi:Tol biopolymer transport system component/DNA-binding winged helix-turn-helix (wHTH) protein
MQGDFRVGDRLVSPKLNRLVRDGREVRIEPKAMQVLLYLAGRPNEVASRDELIREVWRDTFVTDDVLKRCISDLRKAFGDNRDQPQFIETIQKGGYRLIAPVAPAPQRVRWLSAWNVASVALVAAGLAAGAAIWLWGPDPQMEAERLLPVTTSLGWEDEPAISPDGSRIAFTWTTGEPSSPSGQLYVQTIGSPSPLRLTSGPDTAFSPAWSPDGAWVAYLRHADAEGSKHDIVIVPATGGTGRVVGSTDSKGHGLDWSPDERYLAVNDRESPLEPDALYLFSLEDGRKRKLVGPPAGYESDSWPRFSPDGRMLAFIRTRLSPIGEVYVVNVESGLLTRVTHDDAALAGVDWMPDGRNLVVSSSRPVGDRRLWIFPVGGGQARRLDTEVALAVHPSVARKSRRIMVFSALRGDNTIWRVAGPAGESGTPAVQFDRSTSQEYAPQYSPDGQSIAFVSARSGSQEIWVSDVDGSNPRQITFLRRSMTFGPSWSPDGGVLVFSADIEGHINIFLVRAAGGVPERLTKEAADHLFPSFTGDGRYIYFHAKTGGLDQIWRTSVRGGAPVQITRNGGVQGLESPDGKFLYYTKQYWDRGPFGIWRMRLPDGEEQKIVEAAATLAWDVFHRGVVYVNIAAKPQPTLEFFEADRGTTRQLLQFAMPPTWLGFAVSPDGSSVLHGHFETAGTDVVALHNFR